MTSDPAMTPAPEARSVRLVRALSKVTRFSWVSVIAIGAIAIGAYLLLVTLQRRGREVTITFAAANGVEIGTKIEHKAVELGTVTAIRLAPDLSHVDVQVRMTSDADPYLTDKARFWVVRPEVSGGSVSGLNTLISGSYIEMDPGTKGGDFAKDFKGLERPPGRQSDQPGTTYLLRAPTVASLSTGTPVFYRDVRVGEVLGNHISEGTAIITGDVFVRAPYDKRVRTGTVFWQAPGVVTRFEGTSVHVEVPSVQAALSGGVAFAVPPGAPDYPLAAAGTEYPLFGDEAAANRASKSDRILYVVYLEAAAGGLATGAPVTLDGRQVGDVADVRLAPGLATGVARVRLVIELLPGSMTISRTDPGGDVAALAQQLVVGGLRASVETTSYLTGTMAVSLDFGPRLAPGTIPAEDGMTVLPSSGGGMGGGMLTSASGFLTRAQGFPVVPAANGINAALVGMTKTVAGLQPGQQAAALTATLQDARAAIQRADMTVGPFLRDLPAGADHLQQQLQQANRTLNSLDQSYGAGSGMQDRIGQAMAKYYDTVRYVRLFADYLARHPEAIARGTTNRGSER